MVWSNFADFLGTICFTHHKQFEVTKILFRCIRNVLRVK